MNIFIAVEVVYLFISLLPWWASQCRLCVGLGWPSKTFKFRSIRRKKESFWEEPAAWRL